VANHLPPRVNADFVWHREDVLDVYTRPYDPRRPQVCMDEASKQLLRETRAPLPPRPGHPRRYDYEYERDRNATAVRWRFTTADARIKLSHLYPSLEE
jgi:hypothetical protein